MTHLDTLWVRRFCLELSKLAEYVAAVGVVASINRETIHRIQRADGTGFVYPICF